MKTITLVARVPVTDSGSYIAKIRQVVSGLAEFDFKVHLYVDRGDTPELIAQGEVIDLRKTSVKEIVRRILSYVSMEVSDPDMLEKLAGASTNESGELLELNDLQP
ncbi:MAG: hypothetical protein RMH84_04235 [Sulfolobales archaeon]|nr:hypothetical protein [Sulfolobales archaeon]MCX8208648.1 hypothetical protein [Sulfolobales archaeon]MDW8010784.1 hypothetical protein [Sulfolobales archaeon]